jgi:hypothetical protein
MTSAVIYARVSSARQKKDETIRSQTAALRGDRADSGLERCSSLAVRQDDGVADLHVAAEVSPVGDERADRVLRSLGILVLDLAAQCLVGVELCYGLADVVLTHRDDPVIEEAFGEPGVVPSADAPGRGLLDSQRVPGEGI